VLAVVEIEEIVEEVMRAMAREALLEESVIFGWEAARVAERMKLALVIVVAAMGWPTMNARSIQQQTAKAARVSTSCAPAPLSTSCRPKRRCEVGEKRLVDVRMLAFTLVCGVFVSEGAEGTPSLDSGTLS